MKNYYNKNEKYREEHKKQNKQRYRSKKDRLKIEPENMDIQ
jgi:hypothetical protein